MIKNFLGKIAFLVAFLITGAIGYAQKEQWPHTFLWRIDGNGLSKPSFLYGTIHLSDRKLFNFGDSLYHYPEQAEGFNIEIDADTMINAAVRMWSQKNKGRLLKSLLNQKAYDKYADKLSKTLGKPAENITTRDVWLARNQKSAEAYKKGDMQSFMDLYLYGIAKKQGKKVGGIEDIEDQMDIIDDLFDETDIAYLTSDTLQETGVSMTERIKEMYLKQDLNGVESLTKGLASQKFRDIVLNRRNLKMARRMDSLARQRSSFFAVGAAHLPGDTGIITLLREKGFSVEPVFSSRKIAPQNYTYKTVDVPWLNYTHDLHLYQVETPGVLQPMDIRKEVMDMKFYYDVSNGKAYYTAVVNSVADSTKKDSLFTAMIGSMTAQNLTVVSQKNIVKQQYEGRDVILKASKDQVMHLNIFMAGTHAYMAMILTKKSDVNDKDSKRFFESFTMTPASSVSRPYTIFRDTAMAFSIRLPQEPIENEQSNTTDESDYSKEFLATDFSSGNAYTITVTDAKAGRYIPTDSSYLGQVRSNLTAAMREDTVVTMSTYEGYPSLRIEGSDKAGNVYYKTLTVLRGNRSYFLTAQSKRTGTAYALADSFLHSFTLTDYSASDWKHRIAPDNSFTTWLPPRVTDEIEELATIDTTVAIGEVETSQGKKDEAKTDFLFYDNATGTSYSVQREKLPDYYFSENDSTFFSDAGKNFMAEGDSIVSFSLLHVDKDKAADILIQHPNSSIVKKLRFILHGDTLYKVFTYTARWLVANENTQKFFERFSITSVSSPSTMLVNKTGRLIADLTSSDSTSFDNASNYLYKASLHKSDLRVFYPLLTTPLKDFAESPYNTNNMLSEAIAGIADSSTVDFAVNKYHLLKGEQQKLQYLLLKVLVKMNHPYATQSLVRLLQSPEIPSGEASVFVFELYNNLSIAKMLFPKIMTFSREPAAAMAYAYLITTLLDSNYVSRQDVLPYADNFVAALTQQQKNMKGSVNTYDYNIISVLHLLGTINNTAANGKLRDYSKVDNLEIQYHAVTSLIKNNQPLPTDAINRLASSDAFRTKIYDTLASVHKATMFPSAQLSQRLFAASYVYGYATDDDDAPAGLKYMMEKKITFGGKKQKFYLFKVTFGEGENLTQYLGVAGPFEFGTSKVTTTNEATGIYWKEGYADKSINYQFDEYLQQSGQNRE